MGFRGRYEHTIDAKGRLKIPTSYRDEILRRSERAPILTNFENYLALYTYEDWLEIEEKLMSHSNLHPDLVAYNRFVISGAIETPIDSQGRILVPPYLREHAALKSKVTVAGVSDCVEIWDGELFKSQTRDTVADFGRIRGSVSKYLSSGGVS